MNAVKQIDKLGFVKHFLYKTNPVITKAKIRENRRRKRPIH